MAGVRIFAKGLRNTVGMAFNPKTASCGAEQRRDISAMTCRPSTSTYQGRPQLRLAAVLSPRQTQSEYGRRTARSFEPPAITVQRTRRRSALAFYTGTQFPREYVATRLSPLHGSWNRNRTDRAKVVRVEVDSNRPSRGSVDDFMSVAASRRTHGGDGR